MILCRCVLSAQKLLAYYGPAAEKKQALKEGSGDKSILILLSSALFQVRFYTPEVQCQMSA